MARAKRGFKLRRRHKKILKLAKGYRGSRSKTYRVAVKIVRKGLEYAYRDRKVKKREFRSLWIARLNAASRSHGIPYSKFMNGIKKAQVSLNRKQLSELAIHDAAAFSAVVEKVKSALAK
ncbi:MAG: hypothetical protein RI932_1955 [Pseudomonadota bacterium]|jgi:large subunit ribosomal protein L20